MPSNNSPRSVGDRVTIDGMEVEIIKVNQTENFGITYLFRSVAFPALKGLVTEDEIDKDS